MNDGEKQIAAFPPRWRWLRVPLMFPLLPFVALGKAAEVAFDWLDERLR